MNLIKSKDLSLDDFTNQFLKIYNIHKGCGEHCIHLERFWKKIDFDYTRAKQLPSKKQVLLPKFVIDKIVNYEAEDSERSMGNNMYIDNFNQQTPRTSFSWGKSHGAHTDRFSITSSRQHQIIRTDKRPANIQTQKDNNVFVNAYRL